MPTTEIRASKLSLQALEAQARLASVLTESRDIDGVLLDTCRLIEEQLPEVRCAFMRYDAKVDTLSLIVGPSLGDGLRRSLERVDVGLSGPTCCVAIHDGQPRYTDDIRETPGWQGHGSEALAEGLVACWSTPLVIDRTDDKDPANRQAFFGTLDLYFSRPIDGDRESLSSLETVGRLGNQVVRSALRLQRLHRQAHYDPLTGLPNRHHFAHLLRQLIDEQRGHGRFALVAVDIDEFKNINETLGFNMGDLVIQALAKRLASHLREEAVLARAEGDEFLLLLKLSEQDDLSAIAQDLQDVINAPYDFSGQGLFVTASSGVSVYPWDGEDAATLLANTETALRYVKELGGAHFQLFRPTMVRNKPTFDSWWHDSKLGRELRDVVKNEELVLHYQPKFDAHQQTICGTEALMRWQHPQQGLIPPYRFISLAERSGLILPMGEWSLHTACRQAKQWFDSGLARTPIAVNVSAQQLRHGNLIQIICRVLDETGLPADLLELEITERVAMEDGGGNLSRLQALHELGLEISIDDFGTGFSSLSYLSRFPIDTLKIDRSFVKHIGKGGEPDRDSQAIVGAIISMAHRLSLKTVAEGVETDEQLQFMRDNGCDVIQGFLLGRPVPADVLTETLIKRS